MSNIVFMGMGEPMANEPTVWSAVERFHGDLGISARHITISTVGIIPGIRTLATRPLPVNLAVSLHAANDALRDELVPINRRYPIDDLVAACREYLDVRNRRISFEWAMIDGVNDRDSDARELAALCRALRPSAHVNLIPLNPTPGYPHARLVAEAGARVPRPARVARRERDGAPEPRHRDRRRLRPARRRSAGDAEAVAVQRAHALNRPSGRRSSVSDMPKHSLRASAVSVSSSGPCAIARPSRSISTWVVPGGTSSTWWVTST